MSKVTVITPTWNQASFIRDTIESVINQSHKDIEYIIIDNLSDDGTREIVEEYENVDSRILYVREKDHGQAEAINKGLERATGDIVCWLNSDDYFYDNEVLTKVVNAFENDEKLGIVTGNAWYCDKNKNMTEHYIADKKCADWVLSRWYYIVQPSTFWKRNSLRLDENYHYAFDWKYFIEMFREYNYMFLHEDMAVYRMYEDNKTGQDNAKRKKEIYELQNEVNPGSLNAKWCKHVWKRYEKAEKLGKTGMKKRSDLFSRILFHITGKRICSF